MPPVQPVPNEFGADVMESCIRARAHFFRTLNEDFRKRKFSSLRSLHYSTVRKRGAQPVTGSIAIATLESSIERSVTPSLLHKQGRHEAASS
jgi:hypothetical protein